MSSKLLPSLLSIGLLCLVLHEQGLKAVKWKGGTYSKDSKKHALYEAVITGDKSGVSKKTINTMKEFGLMHILTPSGLHLGSFLILFKLYPRLRVLITFILFALSFFIPGFLALKRMLLFYLINYKIRNIQFSFLLTGLSSVLIGNFSESPMSFAFTFIFWGLIVFHSGTKKELALNLFFAQAIVALLFSQKINLAAIIINPLVTALFSLIFPFLLIFFPLKEFIGPGIYIMELLEKLFGLFDYLDFLSVFPEFAIGISLFFKIPKKLFLGVSLVISPSTISTSNITKRKKTNGIYPIASKAELLKIRKNNMDFIDRKCRLISNGDYYCKKKPSKYGGPSI